MLHRSAVQSNSFELQQPAGIETPALVDAVLTMAVLDALTVGLQSLPLLDWVTEHLFYHLLQVYQDKLAALIQAQGVEAIASLPAHITLVSDRKKKQHTLEFVGDAEKIKLYLKSSLSEFFDHASIWQEFARRVGVQLIYEAIATLKEQEASDATLFAQTLQDYIFHTLKTNPAVLQEKANGLGQSYSQDMTQTVIQGFNLPNCSPTDIEQLLGLKQSHPAITDQRLEFDAITVLPTSIPIASSIRAQLRPELWQENGDAIAVFQYRSKSNPANFIEHYITNPGDIALLPWEAAEQIINKFGFNTVKLQLIFAARSMEEAEPWKSTFTLRASDIIQLLGWDKNHSASLPDKRNAIASAAYALSCLLVKSVWMEGKEGRKIDASTPIGRMWDVLIDPHGQFDWVTGRIEKPDEVYITVSPGLWTKHFLNRAGNKAREALHQFGYLAKDILKIDPYHNELALRLAIQLTLDARVRARNENPYDYRVLSLLEEVTPKSLIEQALQDKHKARDLKNRWNSSLRLLMSLGWQIEFDPNTYPDWLQPGSTIEKPPDWRKLKVIERLLQAKLTIKPPHPIPELLGKMKELKKLKPLELCPAIELTGEQIRQGREHRGWSRKELGGFLNLSADYMGKLERGDRVITPELETKLRRLLRL